MCRVRLVDCGIALCVLGGMFFVGGCESTPPPPDQNALALYEKDPHSNAAEDPLDDLEKSEEKSAPVKSSKVKAQKHDDKKVPAPLPLPERFSYFDLQNFLRDSSGIYEAFAPLDKEYALFFKILGQGSTPNDEEIKTLKLRVREGFDRCHWVFVFGLWEVNNYLVNQSKDSLQIDREKNFVARMKTLGFLASALDEARGTSTYLQLARKVYISASRKHFNRTLKEREERPEREDAKEHKP